MHIALGTIESPVGPVTLAARENLVCLVHFGEASDGVRATLGQWYRGAQIRSDADPAGSASVLRRYFDGDLDSLDAVPVELHGTPFQQRVWLALRTVKPGTTLSYSELAARVGSPSAIRAVGAANGANPIAIVLPCHRIIGRDGSLTGYGGGLARKQWLLAHERVGAAAALPWAPLPWGRT